MASRFIAASRALRPLGTAILPTHGVFRTGFIGVANTNTNDTAITIPISTSASRARHMHSTAAAWGIGERMTGAFKRGTEEKQEQVVFDAQLTFLLDRARIPMNGDVYMDFLSAMQSASGMGGIKQHLPWVSNNPGMQDFKDRDAILRAMTPAERRNLTLVKIAAKKRIAYSTGQSIEQVEAVIDQIDAMGGVQLWLHKLEDEGLPLPKSTDEMRTMLAAPGSGLKRKLRKQRGGMPNPGLGKMAKRRRY